MAGNNHYFVQVGEEEKFFAVIQTWSEKQAEKGRLTNVGHCEVKADRILKAKEPHEWENSFHFARTASVVMRLAMLTAAGLQGHSRPFASKEANEENFVTKEVGSVNADGFLGTTAEDAEELSGYFDMQYTPQYISNKLKHGQVPGLKYWINTNIWWQMLVVNLEHKVIWQIISLLNVTTDGMKITSAVPYVIIYRYDSSKPQFSNYPFLPPPPHDDDDDLEFNGLIAKFGTMQIVAAAAPGGKK